MDSVKIKIDDATNYRNNYQQLIIDSIADREHLAILNTNVNKVIVFDLSSKEQVYQIQFKDVGKNGVGKRIRGFYLLNQDSLFLMSTLACRVFLVSREGIKLRTYDICQSGATSNPSGLTRAPLFMIGKFLYMPAHPNVRADGDFWTHKLFIELDVLSGQVRHLFTPPADFEGKSWGVYHHHHTYAMNNKKEVIHNFTFDENLYVRRLTEDKEFMVVPAASRHFRQIEPWQAGSIDPFMSGDEEFYITSNSYKSILWDPWRHVYYRFAERGVDLLDESGMRRDWTDKGLSVIILDSALKIIGETDLRDDSYFIGDSFVTSRGLHISANHEKNKRLEEKFLKFDVFELSAVDN
ncbi:MAG TPA: DUF4221 family protein [Cyclobacteriaceae bacterium]|nr:DUF4221 family protein [Cyclobacteriaceae bacterium]